MYFVTLSHHLHYFYFNPDLLLKSTTLLFPLNILIQIFSHFIGVEGVRFNIFKPSKLLINDKIMAQRLSVIKTVNCCLHIFHDFTQRAGT